MNTNLCKVDRNSRGGYIVTLNRNKFECLTIEDVAQAIAHFHMDGYHKRSECVVCHTQEEGARVSPS